jgi:regulator of sirC expression with transglutaminase-like and TPR domain
VSTRSQFADVVRRPDVPLARAALLIGGEVDPALDVSAGLATLDVLAVSAKRDLDGATSPADLGAGLAAALGERAGFRGSEADYQDLRSSLLHSVLERRRGLPILLSVVWIEVARRAGVPAYGVGLPGHFVVGVGDPDGSSALVDPFRGGAPLPEAEATRLIGRPPAPADLRPWQPTEILLRILANVRAWSADRPDRLRTRLWAVELSLLLPRYPAALRREHGELLGRGGQFLAGADELEAYAAGVETAHPVAAADARQEARMLRARLN